MKHWLLFFCAIIICIISVPFAADKTVAEEKIPTVEILLNGEVTEMSAEEFVLRILLAESEHCQNTEARKALAVSARSCALYLSVFGCKHADFDACSDANCCFALGDLDSADAEILSQCKTAAEETFGEALTVDSLPAMALFTLCSGSGTGDCKEFTYLTAVAEESRCKIHISESEHDFSVLSPLLPDGYTYNKLKENAIIIYSANSKCAFGVLGGKYTEAQPIINALSLKSPEFSIKFAVNGIISTVYGVGHGYGLPLCGAEKCANNGKGYKEILLNYYPNLSLNKMYNN